MTIGLAAIIIVPNLGDKKFRIPLTNTRIPVLIGGTRFPATRDPRLPNWIALATLVAALLAGTLGRSSAGWAPMEGQGPWVPVAATGRAWRLPTCVGHLLTCAPGGQAEGRLPAPALRGQDPRGSAGL